jgi:2-polyprenyl-3-methyl-5-hydroxy-6-metoxy-1,4-benzoquinol methylase
LAGARRAVNGLRTPWEGVTVARVSLERASEVEKFDHYAKSYREAHRASVRLSGEPPEYFAEHKLVCLERAGVVREASVLDYGCGTGSLTRLLAGRHASVAGYDPSEQSLDLARRGAPTASFYGHEGTIPDAAFDVAILSGVLHHVPPAERAGVVAGVVRKLVPGGRLFVFEHNPYNPVTRRAVAACPFDDDAILLAPREIRALLSGARLSSVEQDYVLFFPRPLARLRPLEPLLRWCPLGAQTLTSGAAPALDAGVPGISARPPGRAGAV